MTTFQTALNVILLIFVVVMLFNVVIFVHELGHFLAGKWRGLQIDRFQIWFGKPIWKKEYKGVQYGLGWIPAGGFVALPQMAPMEGIEGNNRESKVLPPISPLDKIIVAAAGPLFSILLALVAACVVWLVGKQKDFIPTTTIGYVEAGMPGDKAGLQAGDEILSINGQSVNGFAGSLDSISEQIVLSSGDKIEFMVNRPGIEKPLKLISGFDTPPTKWFQRSSLRQVGIESAQPALVGKVYENSPGSKAGLDKGDTILSANGTELFSGLQLNQYLKKSNYQSVTIDVKKVSGEIVKMELTPEKPSKPKDSKPMIGILWDMSGGVDVRIVHPTPFEQVYNSIRMMYVTITKVADPKSSIGVDQLNGPIGIGKMIYQLLLTDEGWRRIIGFMVLLNVNLAIFNMLPFPVLDGGHITLAVLEKIAGRPVKTKALEIIQTACLFVIFSLFLYVTSKDILDPFGRGKGGALAEPVFSK